MHEHKHTHLLFVSLFLQTHVILEQTDLMFLLDGEKNILLEQL